MWKDIPGYEGYYAVSDDGQVKSLNRDIVCQDGIHHISARLMKQSVSNGYYVVNLRKPGHTRVWPVHKLVAMAFIANPDSLPVVNHIDGDKTNNHVSNLEWASYAWNNQHAYGNGLHQPWGYKVNQYDLSGVLVASYANMYEAARKLGVTPGCISNCIHGRAPTACGYIWKQIR